MDKLIYDTGYGMVPKSIMYDEDVSLAAKGVFSYLTTYTNGFGDIAFPSRDLMCKHLGVSKDSITKYIKELKENGFKPLYYKDYRKIAGKLCKENPEEVIIEFINYESFKIIFCPGNTVIYSGSLFDLSFGTFIMDYFRKELKEMNEKNNTCDKNGTYGLWGNTFKYNESAVSADSAASSTSNAIHSNMSNNSDYSNTLGVDYNNTISSYYSFPQDYYSDLEKRLQKLEEA